MTQALAIGGTLGGSAVSAVSAIQQGDYQAQVAQNNAAIARQSARYATQAGAEQEQQQLFKTAGIVSAARAAQGSSGLDVNSGSSVGVRASDAALGNLSALEIRSNTLRTAYGDELQATTFEDNASADVAAGRNAAFGDILSGIGQTAGLASQLMSSGALPGAGSPGIAA